MVSERVGFRSRVSASRLRLRFGALRLSVESAWGCGIVGFKGFG
jgi:hypothetical protein